MHFIDSGNIVDGIRISGERASNDLIREAEVVSSPNPRLRSNGGFTLMEVMMVMGLLTILMVGAAGAISTGRMVSRRLSDYAAALAVVEAKLNDIRVATYNPPNSPFGSSAVVLTSTSSIALNQAGASFVVPGTVTSRIEPIASGHLVTVTGTFQTRRTPITVSVQTVLNKFSGGQQ